MTESWKSNKQTKTTQRNFWLHERELFCFVQKKTFVQKLSNLLVFAPAQNASWCGFTRFHPCWEDELQQLKSQDSLAGYLSVFVLGSNREIATSSQERGLCWCLLILPKIYPKPRWSIRATGKCYSWYHTWFWFPSQKARFPLIVGWTWARSKQGLSTGIWLQRSRCHTALWYPSSSRWISPLQNIFRISGTYKFKIFLGCFWFWNLTKSHHPWLPIGQLSKLNYPFLICLDKGARKRLGLFHLRETYFSSQAEAVLPHESQ